MVSTKISEKLITLEDQTDMTMSEHIAILHNHRLIKSIQKHKFH